MNQRFCYLGDLQTLSLPNISSKVWKQVFLFLRRVSIEIVNFRFCLYSLWAQHRHWE